MGSAIDPNGGMGAGAGTQGLCNYQKRDQNQKRYALTDAVSQLPVATNAIVDEYAGSRDVSLPDYSTPEEVISPGEGHQVYHST